MTKDFKINEQIKAREVLVIDEDGKKLGTYLLQKAQDIAVERNLDLVEISPEATPPVCKLLNYDKLRFSTQKAETKQKKIDTSEIKMSVRIAENDRDVKIRTAIKNLKDGNNVKLSVIMRGRENSHPEIAAELLKVVYEKITPFGKIISSTVVPNQGVVVMISPIKDGS